MRGHCVPASIAKAISKFFQSKVRTHPQRDSAPRPTLTISPRPIKATSPHSRGQEGSEGRTCRRVSDDTERGVAKGRRDAIIPVGSLGDGGALVHPIPSLHSQLRIAGSQWFERRSTPYELLPTDLRFS